MYIKKLTAKFGSFVFPECKTLFDPFKEDEQLEQMIPNYRSHANALINKKSTSNSDLTYKIVKTADNNLSIIKKNDKEGAHEKTQPHIDHKHGKQSTTDAADDLKYQVMKRDKETSRVDGRVDSVILKRKAESPSPSSPSPVEPSVDGRKKMKLLINSRRMSTPTASKAFSNGDNCKNIVKVTTDRRTTITKTSDDEPNRIDRKSSSKPSRDTPSKDLVNKSNIKEDLISAVVKKLDKLQAFVATNDNCKMKNVDSVSLFNKAAEQELCVDSQSSNDNADQPMTVIPQRNEQSNAKPAAETSHNKSKSDEDENLLVPMHDRPVHDMNDSKKDLQMAAIISSRQGSMSRSASGSLDDPFEMSIKTEPVSGDEMDSSTDISSDRTVALLDHNLHNGSLDSSLSKISVKNISLMTRPRPMEQMHRNQVAVRRLQTNKSGK